MKRFLLAVFVLFLGHSMVFSQLSIRPQVGVNFASFSGDFSDDWKSGLGYQFGVDVQIGGTIYIQPGLNYQSTKLTFEDVEDIDLTTNRLNVPILVGFRLFEQEDESFGARVFAGPNMALHLGEDFDSAVGGLSGDDFKSAHFAGLLGAGLDIGMFFVDVAYKFGITDYFDIDNLDEDVNKNIFFVNAGVRLGK